MDVASFAATIIFGLFSVAAIALFIWAEVIRRPVFRVERDEDKPQAGDPQLWIHLLISNRKPPWILARELAVNSIARISFLDHNTGAELVPAVPQIEAHWSSQPEPRDAQGTFLHWLIPTAIRKNVGLRPEKIDVLVKLANGDCHAANPRILYKLNDPNPNVRNQALTEFAALRLPAAACKVRVEIEAANLGRRSTHEFLFRNTGLGLADFAWEHLPIEPGGERKMTTGQRFLLWVVAGLGLLLVAKFSSVIGIAISALPPIALIVLAILVIAIGFSAAYRALAR